MMLAKSFERKIISYFIDMEYFDRMLQNCRKHGELLEYLAVHILICSIKLVSLIKPSYLLSSTYTLDYNREYDTFWILSCLFFQTCFSVTLVMGNNASKLLRRQFFIIKQSNLDLPLVPFLQSIINCAVLGDPPVGGASNCSMSNPSGLDLLSSPDALKSTLKSNSIKLTILNHLDNSTFEVVIPSGTSKLNINVVEVSDNIFINNIRIIRSENDQFQEGDQILGIENEIQSTGSEKLLEILNSMKIHGTNSLDTSREPHNSCRIVIARGDVVKIVDVAGSLGVEVGVGILYSIPMHNYCLEGYTGVVKKLECGTNTECCTSSGYSNENIVGNASSLAGDNMVQNQGSNSIDDNSSCTAQPIEEKGIKDVVGEFLEEERNVLSVSEDCKSVNGAVFNGEGFEAVKLISKKEAEDSCYDDIDCRNQDYDSTLSQVENTDNGYAVYKKDRLAQDPDSLSVCHINETNGSCIDRFCDQDGEKNNDHISQETYQNQMVKHIFESDETDATLDLESRPLDNGIDSNIEIEELKCLPSESKNNSSVTGPSDNLTDEICGSNKSGMYSKSIFEDSDENELFKSDEENRECRRDDNETNQNRDHIGITCEYQTVFDNNSSTHGTFANTHDADKEKISHVEDKLHSHSVGIDMCNLSLHPDASQELLSLSELHLVGTETHPDNSTIKGIFDSESSEEDLFAQRKIYERDERSMSTSEIEKYQKIRKNDTFRDSLSDSEFC